MSTSETYLLGGDFAMHNKTWYVVGGGCGTGDLRAEEGQGVGAKWLREALDCARSGRQRPPLVTRTQDPAPRPHIPSKSYCHQVASPYSCIQLLSKCAFHQVCSKFLSQNVSPWP